MAISQDEIKKIAALARLSLKEDELALYQSQLVRILDSMAELSKADTSKVAPMTTLSGKDNVWREDDAKPFGRAEALLENAPSREGPFFKVPKVIEE